MAGGLNGISPAELKSLSDTIAIVPARFGSSRLPGKPLADVAGLPLVVRVLRGLEGAGLLAVAAATDDARIRDAVEAHGHLAVMTGEASSGTERVLMAWEEMGCPGSRIINVQGDEPLVDKRWVEALASLPPSPDRVATLARSVPRDAAGSGDMVKVAAGEDGRALYFSRLPIPWGADPLLEHMGVYSFSPESLRACVASGTTLLSATERLEQLAWLEAGIEIMVVECGFRSISVDTTQDLEKAVEHFSRGKHG